MLVSQTRLRQLLGALWLLDGLLQLQPEMFTMNMINGIMFAMNIDQPGFVGTSLRWITAESTAHLSALNIVIAVVQISLGLLLLSGRWVRPAILASIAWALIVWYGGEGLSLLLTGQASALTGFPGAVLLYPVLGLVVYPRAPRAPRRGATARSDQDQDGLLPRRYLPTVLGSLFVVAALLQLQPYWWQADQISLTIKTMVGAGGLDGVLVDPVLRALSALTAGREIPVNLALTLAFLGVGVGLLRARDARRRPVLLAAAVVVVAVFWYSTEALGTIFSGMATDPNSGLLLILLAFTCWPTGWAGQPAARRLPWPARAQPAS